uniref:Glycosyltransferase 2-like domain-containing protein n=1 Tax=viral metagenome TaxID=1070528 RepID=A0A6C0B8M7_9ZZZZ
METKITFIIPTIGRSSLRQTVECLLQQTKPYWKAIIIFDGIEPTIHSSDNRITIFKHTKLGVVNYAGAVRNYGISYATTEWVAFVDDDDVLKNTYVETFYREIKYNSDIIIFRMNVNSRILPPINCNNFHIGQVGISFAVKKLVFDDIVFEPSEYEDFGYLDKCRAKKYRIMISPYLLYFVRNCNPFSNVVSNRVFIQNK